MKQYIKILGELIPIELVEFEPYNKQKKELIEAVGILKRIKEGLIQSDSRDTYTIKQISNFLNSVSVKVESPERDK